uniref:Uncharacterized protein n=1 Tax=Arundo donax TaxID=35708 RepID=A0A0A9GAP5_ARUDO
MLSPRHLHPCSSIRERSPHSTAFATSMPEHASSSSSPTAAPGNTATISETASAASRDWHL